MNTPNTTSTSTTSTPAFPAGTFTPDPRRASLTRMVASQARIESLLFLRHGEQQLLSLFIPFMMLVGLSVTDVTGIDHPVMVVFPMTLAISAMSAGFTGQAIAVAFDRRYGALKRIGASGVPAWTIIAGKVMGVWAVSIVQTVILGTTALALGWHAPLSHILIGLVVLVVGVAAFTAIGLLLGGTLSSEIVLALANLIWFILAGAAGWSLVRSGGNVPGWMNLVPSIALADGLADGFRGAFPVINVALLSAWTAAAGIAANKLFKFS